MLESDDKINAIFAGLKAIADSAFPKECSGCAKVYLSLPQMVESTTPVKSQSGLEEEAVDECHTHIQLSRLCSCGTNISAQFEDRRESNGFALKRRDMFEHLLAVLIEGGMPRGMAKTEIIKVMRGEPSALLTNEQLQRLFA